MKIIITGHKGFLGNALVQRLKDKYVLTGISREKNESNQYLQAYSSDEICEIKETPDVVVMCHAAVASGNNQLETGMLYQSNVRFTAELIKKFPDSYFLYVSSVSVYGNQSQSINEETQAVPITEYAISKLWGEKVVSTANNYGVIRLSSLYGTGMKENTIIPNYVNQAISKGSIEVWGKGERKQNYLYVEDAADYIENMIIAKAQGVFIGAASKEVSNTALAQIIAEHTGAKISFIKEDNSPSAAIDNSATRKRLGITEETDLKEGLKNYIYWKQKQF